VRRFDICEIKPRGLVVILQHDSASDFDTRIVAPLSTHLGKRIVSRARHQVQFEGKTYILQLDRMAAVEVKQIGAVRGSLSNIQDDIKNGTDLLLFGF
jgi:transcriptional antiterminator Rof (Rho-off)